MADENGPIRPRSQAITLPNDHSTHPDYERFTGATGLLFEQAMAQTRMAVCLSDPRQKDDPIVFCNEAFCHMTGYEPHEIVGRNCRFLQGPKTSEEPVAKIRDAVRTEKVVVVELLNYRKDGTEFWSALHLGPIYDEQGELICFFGSQWDVSDIHQARSGAREPNPTRRRWSGSRFTNWRRMRTSMAHCPASARGSMSIGGLRVLEGAGFWSSTGKKAEVPGSKARPQREGPGSALPARC